MNPYTKVCLVAGLCATTYLLLKFIKSCMEQEPKKKIEPEKEVDENNTKSSSSEESKLKKKSVSFGARKSGDSKRKKSEENTETMKIARPRPNFFIAVQIFDREIHEKVKNFQEMIIKRNPLLYPALIPVSTLHITLAVTHLANETEIKTLKEKLQEWSDKNVQSLMKEPITLNFNGVNTFNDVVAYVSLKKNKDCEKLYELSHAMDDVLSSAGFTNESKRFAPHLTILKLSRDYNLLRARKNFKDDFLVMKQCKERFGKQDVKYIQLLSMNEPKDKNEYYKCYHQIDISNSEVEIDHSICCCPIPEPEVNKGKT